MSLKRIILPVVIILILSSCSNQFDIVMRSGKNALKAEKYDKAVEKFEEALIEQPRDEDAKILLDRARKGLKKVKTIEQIDLYYTDIELQLNEFDEIYLKYSSEYFQDSLNNSITADESLDSEKLKRILIEVKILDSKYQGNSGLLDLNKTFIEAIVNTIENLEKGSGLLHIYRYGGSYNTFNDTLNQLIELKGK